MICANYTSALNVQLVNQLGPFVVAMMSSAFLGEQLPKFLGPTLLLCFVGAVIAIVSEKWSAAKEAELSPEDALGMSLAFVSVVASGAMRIFMKKTQKTHSEASLITWQYSNCVPFALFVTFGPGGSPEGRLGGRWEPWGTLSPKDVYVVISFVLMIYVFGNYMQVASTRNLGPTMAGMLQPLRLVSTVFGSWLILGTSVQSIFTWLGLALITGGLITFLLAQRKK